MISVGGFFETLKVLDSFVALCDGTTGKENMILGSCQIAALANGNKLGPFMKRLTLAEIFEKSSALRQAEQEQEYNDEEMARTLLDHLLVKLPAGHFLSKSFSLAA